MSCCKKIAEILLMKGSRRTVNVLDDKLNFCGCNIPLINSWDG